MCIQDRHPLWPDLHWADEDQPQPGIRRVGVGLECFPALIRNPKRAR